VDFSSNIKVVLVLFTSISQGCTLLGGALLLIQKKLVVRIILFLLQILVLSSNTKKGEIERAYFVSLIFCVLNNNIRIIRPDISSRAR
jgi:hypothetical protein